MKKLGFLLCLTVFLVVSGAAQQQRRAKTAEAGKFEAKIYEKGGKRMPYRLFVPANYDKNKKYPLVLWLHGGAGRGSDNEKQIGGGNTLGATLWTTPENQAKNPAFVLAPQCPPGEWWANNDAEMKPSKHLETVVELLRDLQKQYGGIDADRLYVAGQSLGGYGAWALIAEYPEMFAAAIPLCGGGNAARAKNLVNVSIWAFHGEEDKAVDVKESRKMIEAVRKAGGSPKYTEYKGVGHAVWLRAFAEPELLPWVFAQKRKSGK